MPFPPSNRVRYEHNTLRQVICQIRFPAILRIESGLPIGFQERIRQEYPIFQEKLEGQADLPPEVVKLLPQALAEAAFHRTRAAYEFLSADEVWTLTLTREFLALTTSEYRLWRNFREHFGGPLEALKEEYAPAFFTRIGLRYHNVIRRSELGLEDARWSDLIQPALAGPLADPNVQDSINDIQQVVIINLSGNAGQVRIQHGVARDEDEEDCYVIDSDFFTNQRTGVNHALEVLDEFNRRGARLFRWAVSPKLHEAMGAEPLPPWDDGA
ncbi:MAG TPA: TIGR04255 family protein [Ardenticatenaceae bacterium]|nr:TIGR04255 family protein [Ardenticatenaceae bacterium]